MHIIIKEDPDDGFRSKVGRYWWELICNGETIAMSPRADFPTHHDARIDAIKFLRVLIYLGEECTIKEESEC